MRKLCIAVVAACVLSSCGGNSTASDTTSIDNTTDTTVVAGDEFEYTMTIGENTGADVVIEVVLGQSVTLKVVNPKSHDEVHLHGYDLSTGTIEKGEVGTMTFSATQTGEFEIESHETEELVSILKVTAP